MRIREPERVLRAIAAQPWAIEEEKAREILAFLDLRAQGIERSDEEIAAIIQGRRDTSLVPPSGGVAVIPLFGVVAPRMDSMSAISGGMSCERFAQQFDAAIANSDVKTIVIHVDSPGGSVQGVPELAKKIFEARGQKRVIAIANGMMASAAYWIASAADEIIVTPSGAIGSIGVFSIHTEFSRFEDAAGVTTTIVRAGKFKAEANSFEPLTEEAREHLQEGVNDFYDLFIRAIADHRDVTPEQVRSGLGQGRVLTAVRGVEERLADRVATFEEVLEELGVGVARLADARAEDEQVPVAASVEVDALPSGGDPASETVIPAAADVDASVATHSTLPEAPPVAMEEIMKTTENGSVAEAAGVESTSSSVGVTAAVDLEAERSRAGTIADLCSFAGVPARAAGFIQSQASVDDVRESLRAEAEQNLEAMTASGVELTERETKQYSLTRAIMSQVDEGERWSGFEREVSDQIAKTLPEGYNPQGGILVPIRQPRSSGGSVPVTAGSLNRVRALIDRDRSMPFNTRQRLLGQIDTMHAALDSGTAGAGQELMFTEAGDFIDMLRARMKVAELGATILTGLTGNVSFPRQTGAGTFAWVAEDPGADVAESDLVLAQIALNARTGTSTTAYSRQLLNQGIVDVDNLVKGDLALITALGIDLSAIAGSGAGNEPTGVLNTAGIGAVAIGTNGGAPLYEHVVDLETDVATADADIGSLAYLSTPGARGKLKKTEEFAGANGRPVWTGGMAGELNGYRAEVSTQVPSNLSKGTGNNLHAIIFGVWSQLMIGHWGAYELVVDAYTKKKQGLIELTSFQQAGIAVRNPEAFSAIKDASVV